jgi:signal transduction histidine kinase
VSLRSRLLLVSMSTLAVGLGALLVVGNVLLGVRIRDEASSLLRARADAQLAALTVTRDRIVVRESPNDNVLDRRSWVLQGDTVLERPAGASAALDRQALALGRAGKTAERAGPDDVLLRAQRVIAPVTGRTLGSVVVALSLEPLELLQQEVLVGSLIVAALVLVAAALAIRVALGGLLRPVAQMTASAEDWGAHDLDRRFNLGPPRDELTGLAATLDGLLERIAGSRRHEQRFASDVAHELRTPIARLRGRAELALAAGEDQAAAERDAALRTVVEQVDELTETIDTLLAMARRQLDADPRSTDVESVAREHQGVEVHVQPDLPRAEGEPEVIRRALAPLVENARRHARSRVELDVSAAEGRVRIAVRDDGPGFQPGLGDPFEPGTRGDEGGSGAGLGLPLARRLARSCGGDVRVGPGPGGCVVLELPAAAARDGGQRRT